ncbi:uncharacterized protein LOC129712313 isoform X1 [Leucoraja erinacea]|uniref:uncharacterized protein LOC129712313 isoform X1 n=1 Tax=Leucoraja erinaceus TaxID=7782 RepID=UPI002458ED75|nr:uncharacterized protein LOC129712313 isoform X1 [Leucoraja erinacea]
MDSVLPALLLVLFIQYAPTYSQLPACEIENATMGGDFNLTIYPMYYKVYIHYNVTVSGFGENATIVLSSYFNGSAVGMWLNNATDCDGFKGNRSMYAMEQWVSPFVIGDYVKIRAFVYTMNGTYVKSLTLKQMPMTTTPTTTEVPTTTTPTTTEVVITTKPMGTTVYMSKATGTTTTAATTTPNSAPGISSKPLLAFVCMLLLLVTVPGL